VFGRKKPEVRQPAVVWDSDPELDPPPPSALGRRRGRVLTASVLIAALLVVGGLAVALASGGGGAADRGGNPVALGRTLPTSGASGGSGGGTSGTVSTGDFAAGAPTTLFSTTTAAVTPPRSVSVSVVTSNLVQSVTVGPTAGGGPVSSSRATPPRTTPKPTTAPPVRPTASSPAKPSASSAAPPSTKPGPSYATNCTKVMDADWVFGADAVISHGEFYCNLKYRFGVQPDGNLIVTRADGTPLWAAGTFGRATSYAVMQGDGNLVVDLPGNKTIWAAGVYGHANQGFTLAFQRDGNLVIYGPSPAHSAYWASGTANW